MQASIDKHVLEATRYFILTVQLGSMSKVKDASGSDINTIKNKIKYLEDYLGKELLKIDTGRYVATSDGMAYFLNMSNLYENFENRIQAFKHNSPSQNKSSVNLLMPFGFSLFFTEKILNTLPLQQKYNYSLDTYSTHNALKLGQEFIKNISSYDIILLRSDLIHLIDDNEWNLVYSGKSEYGLYTTQDYLNSLTKQITDIKQLSDITFICRTEECPVNILELQNKQDKRYKIPVNVSYRLEYDLLKSTLILNNMGIGTIDTYRAALTPNLVRLFPDYKLIGNDFEFSIIIRNALSKELSSLRTTIRDKITSALNKAKSNPSL